MLPPASDTRELVRLARDVIDSNQYLTLATVDGDGRPWASPVWFAHDAYADFLWVSRPGARHSRHLTSCPDVAIVIFDSTAPPNDARAVYVEAVAAELAGNEREAAMEVYTARSEARGLRSWTVSDVTMPAAHRLYRATARRHFVLHGDDQRVAIRLRDGGGPAAGRSTSA